jgi:hypothetical protein
LALPIGVAVLAAGARVDSTHRLALCRTEVEMKAVTAERALESRLARLRCDLRSRVPHGHSSYNAQTASSRWGAGVRSADHAFGRQIPASGGGLLPRATLLRMKELETLEKVTEKIDKLTVFGGLDGVLKDMGRIQVPST